MNRSIKTICGVVVVALATAAASALAQAPIAGKAYCVSVGMSPMEPIGDCAGHALQVATYSCRTEGGPMDGGVLSGVTTATLTTVLLKKGLQSRVFRAVTLV